jgi:hypothetical protein
MAAAQSKEVFARDVLGGRVTYEEFVRSVADPIGCA